MSAGLAARAEHVAAAAPERTPRADVHTRSTGAACTFMPREAWAAHTQRPGRAAAARACPGRHARTRVRGTRMLPTTSTMAAPARMSATSTGAGLAEVGRGTTASRPPPLLTTCAGARGPRRVRDTPTAHVTCQRCAWPCVQRLSHRHHLIGTGAGIDMHRQIRGALDTWRGSARFGVARRDVGARQRGGVLPAGPQVGLAQHRVRDQVRLHQLGPRHMSARAGRTRACQRAQEP
jgi:hypothetical protein